jgi:hypothetical protein
MCDQIPEDMSGFMVNVILPTSHPEAASYVTSTLNSTYNIYMVTGSVVDSRPGRVGTPILFTRLSAQIYLELSDFTQLGKLVPDLLEAFELQKNA